MDTVLANGDDILALSADDDTIRLRETIAPFDASSIVRTPPRARRPERILVLGWNERGRFIIRELDQYVAPGTEIVVVDHVDRSSDVERIRTAVSNSMPTFHQARTTSREVLDALDVTRFDSVIVLADSTLDVQQADARTIMTLVHLRDITSGRSAVNIVTEMLDERNRSLAAADGINDFIISNTIISLLLTQIAENRDLHAVFRDLFDAAGSELYLKPVTDYVRIGGPISMATLVRAASERNEIAVGLKIRSGSDWAVRLNIPKSEQLTLSADDMVVVVAED
jgi:voltage-gated potassium channel Kch